jgi:Holliday junction resolvase
MTHSRDKGKRGELEVVALFRKYGFDAERVPLSGATNVMKGDALVDVPDLHVEVKRAERICLPEWIEQASAQAAAEGKTRWLLCLRRNNERWRAVLDLETLLAMLAALYAAERSDETPATLERPGA